VVRQVQYQGYVQKFTGAVAGSHVVPPSTGNVTSLTTSAQASYSYNPGTGAQQYTSPAAPATLEHRSLYTTKSIENLTSATLNAPGHVLRHTLIYDVSDYFSFDDLQISDSIGDGQTYVSGSLQVTVQEGSTPGTTRTEAQLLAIPGSPLQPITRNMATGVWNIALDLSSALVAALPDGYAAPDGVLTGDENRSPSAPGGSPTRVVITYTTTIDEEFTGPVAGTAEVDGGDVISDTMGADFRVLGTSNRQTLNGPTASITITPILIFEKEVEFENGIAPSDPLEVSPGETITYRLSFQVPTGDVEGLELKDFVPSPLFNVTDPDADGVASGFTFDPVASNAAPAPGVVHLTTASAPVGVVVTTDATSNYVSFSFDNESNVTSATTLIELLFTITATSSPMADDLLLVNVAYLFQNSSQSLVPINQLSSVSPLLTSEPKLVVRKAASSVVSGVGTVQGTGANANFVGVQPGARLAFQVQVENVGSYGAVDVSLVDTMPAPYTIVGATLTTSNCNTSGGITDTSSPTEINLAQMEIPAGQVCTVEYQVDVSTSAALGAVITNTATSRYASTSGGPLFAPERDNATTSINSPSLTKTLAAGTSSDTETAEGSLRSGESALFDVVVSVPPGTADSFTIRERDVASGSTSPNFFENFDTGSVVLPSVENNVACGGDFNFVGNTNLCFTLNPNSTAAQSSATVHQVNLGSVRNLSGTAQSFTFRYRATVRGGIVPGAYVNRADVQWVTQNSTSSGSTSSTLTSLTATAPFTVVRPQLTLTKSTPTSSPVTVGQAVVYVLTLTNTGGSSAHDVANIVDTLPAGLGTATLVSATLNGSSVTGVSGFSFTQSGSQITATVRNLSGLPKLAAGDIYAVTFQAPLSASVGGAVTSLVNTAQVVSYSSGAADGGPRETYTDIPQASASIGVNSSNIYGRVVFSKETAGGTTQNGVAGATVSIVGTSFTTTTDTNGNFSFSGVPNGTYTVRSVSIYGDVIGEETITVNNADVHNVVFQARPRIVLTKSTSTAGPVAPGQLIDYTIKLENLGNYPAFQVANIVDVMVKGMETATLVSAKHSGADVTSVSGFSFQQSGLTITISVRNAAGEARLNPGQTYEVAYRVSVSSVLKGVAITIPNSATLASYATTAATGATTETYLDVRCGGVRLELTDDYSSKCVSSSLTQLISSVDTRAGEMARGVSRAVALRKQYAAAGYCKARDNGCFTCNKKRSKCFNACRMPSSSDDKALVAAAAELENQIEATTKSKLVAATWSIECTASRVCALSDMADPKADIADSSRRLSDMVTQVLDSCCLRTSRASAALKKRRSSIRQVTKRDLKQMNSYMAEYPSPALLCQ
jgi:fimbrial isopeptide formation D2 family protein